MSLRFQRLIIILASLVLITGSLILILNNYKKNIIFFYTPTELIKADANINQKVRIGGFIKQNSIKNIASLKTHITFIVTDKENDIFVEYKGILPDLFQEGQGAVIEGILTISPSCIVIERTSLDWTFIFSISLMPALLFTLFNSETLGRDSDFRPAASSITLARVVPPLIS